MVLSSLLACVVLLSQGSRVAAPWVSPRPPVGTVWVDDDFGPGTAGWGLTHFATIAEGLLAVDAGGTVRVLPGTYPEVLEVTRPVRLEGAGAPDTTILGNGYPASLTITASDTSVRGFRFLNQGLSGTAIVVQRADRCTLADNVMAGNTLDIRAWPDGSVEVAGLQVLDNTGIGTLELGIGGLAPVRAARIERNEARAIRLEEGLDTRIADNVIDAIEDGTYHPGIALDGSTACEVRGNHVRSQDSGITLFRSPANLLAENTVEGPFYTGIDVRSGSHDVLVLDNVLREGTGRGIVVAYADRAQLIGNRVELPEGATGLLLNDSESDRLEGNAFTGGGIVVRGELPLAWDSHLFTDNTLAGRPIVYAAGATGLVAPSDAGQVILARCSDFTIAGIVFPAGAPGVQLGACDGGRVRACEFLAGTPSALYASDCQEIDVHGNALLDGPESALELGARLSMEHCSASRIRDNRVVGPSSLLGPGLQFLYCEDLEISGNTIASFPFALLLRYGPGGCLLHGNAFCAYSTVIDDCQNTWDDGNGSGNYWDDYAGPDADGDGIGDTPQPVYRTVVDAHPLMTPPGGAILWADRHRLSAGAGGTTTLVLEAGRPRAGRRYAILGSASGISPGIGFGGLHLPLNPDAYLRELRTHPDADGRNGFVGALDANGRTQASLTLPAGSDPALAGVLLNHAGVVFPFEPVIGHVQSIGVLAITEAVPLQLLE